MSVDGPLLCGDHSGGVALEDGSRSEDAEGGVAIVGVAAGEEVFEAVASDNYIDAPTTGEIPSNFLIAPGPVSSSLLIGRDRGGEGWLARTTTVERS